MPLYLYLLQAATISLIPETEKAHSRLALCFCPSHQLPCNSSAKSCSFLYRRLFSAGIPAGWTNVDSNNVGVAWKWTTTGAFQPNVNGDDNFLSPTEFRMQRTDTWCMTQTQRTLLSVVVSGRFLLQCYRLFNTSHCSFDYGGTNTFLMFEDAAAIFPNTGHVYVSTDSTTWYLVHAAEAGLTNNTGAPNPSAVVENISVCKHCVSGNWLFTETGHGTGCLMMLNCQNSFSWRWCCWWFHRRISLKFQSNREAFADRRPLWTTVDLIWPMQVLVLMCSWMIFQMNVFTGTSSVVPLIASVIHHLYWLQVMFLLIQDCTSFVRLFLLLVMLMVLTTPFFL